MSSSASPPPSPPLPDSPGSLSSASSSTSSGDPPKPASPPPLTYTSFDAVKSIAPSSRSSATTGSPANSVVSTRTGRSQRGPGHRPAHSMSRLPTTVTFIPGAGEPRSKASGGVSPSPSLRRSARSTHLPPVDVGRVQSGPRSAGPSRSRTLSFSSAQQAFVPPTPRLTSVSSGESLVFPFPSIAENPTSSSSSASPFTHLDRTPSCTSYHSVSATVPSRRPQPRTSLSASTRSAHTLRVPGSSAGRLEQREAATEYLEAKVVILGSQAVGKTSLLNTAAYGRWDRSKHSTIGASLHKKKIQVGDTAVNFQLWDTGGQEKYRSIAPLYYRGAAAAILVYDMTDEESLGELQYWLGELRKERHPPILHVVGTKADLADSFATVPLEDAQRSIALWLYDLDHPVPEPQRGQPSHEPNPQPPPLVTRSRTFSAPLSSSHTYPNLPSITTSLATPPGALSAYPYSSAQNAPPFPQLPEDDSFSSQMRQTFSRLTSATSSAHVPLSSSTSARPTRTLTTSFTTLPDLAGYTLSSLAPSSPAPPQLHSSGSAAVDSLAVTSASMQRGSSGNSYFSSSHSPSHHAPMFPSLTLPYPFDSIYPPTTSDTASSDRPKGARGLVRSPTAPARSRGGLMAFPTLTSTSTASCSSSGRPSSSRRMSHDDRLRREAEEAERARRREREGREEEKVRRIVEECRVRVVEVSAKEGVGIEEIFSHLGAELIARKAELLEAQRTLRSRDSIILREEDAIDVSKPGWCAC